MLEEGHSTLWMRQLFAVTIRKWLSCPFLGLKEANAATKLQVMHPKYFYVLEEVPSTRTTFRLSL
jgi:hypothetical protein